ncbi:DUF5000 domain-containing lipoprotein [Niabella yanshanensis]|uniref:DUF5000 domain-containing lipoprotein n=1 Tax=Niabella yanshanensis TaxID=577386 RepID=A0ABZ0W7W0_9BACT|nr:DUF5000 domain-containing lipoprotein [Niabella yanshanensis]WQD39365.1 DUF5000 domain-containing lipoprotein [Niabella yanshanensis]
MQKIQILALAGILVFTSCKKDKLGPIENNEAMPQPVSNVSFESMPGAIKLTYDLPSNSDILYVEGDYTNKQGDTKSVKASYYTNNLILEGFADTDEYVVNIRTVSRSEVRSEPKTIKVRALTPPVLSIFQTLAAREDFGGINVTFSNPTAADVAVVICYKDSTGEFVNNETFYTKVRNANFTSRGFESKQTTFGVYLRDRWNNLSDTLQTTVTPIFEKQLDKGLFRQVLLPTDIADGWGLPIPNLWDGKVAPDGVMWHSADGQMPMHITFDLGVLAKLSRFTLWQRSGSYLYNHGNPKRYEIWGSDAPPADGSWNNWTLLASCVSVKPSENSLGDNTAEDIAAAALGEQTNIPLSAPKVRYIRVKILETWSGGIASHISEMTFWGNAQ